MAIFLIPRRLLYVGFRSTRTSGPGLCPFGTNKAAPQRLYKSLLLTRSHSFFAPTTMSSPQLSPDYSSDSAMPDASPLLQFDDTHYFPSADSDQLIFGPLDLEDNVFSPSSPATTTLPIESPPYNSSGWATLQDMDLESDAKAYDFSAPSSVSTSYGFANSFPSSFGSYGSFGACVEDTKPPAGIDTGFYSISSWVHDQEASPTSPTSPIPIPTANSQGTSFIPFLEQSAFPHDMDARSPAGFAAMHPLPCSVSPSVSSFDAPQHFTRQRVDSFDSASVSPQDTSMQAPSWASHLWEGHTNTSSLRSASSPRHSVRHSPLNDSSHRSRMPSRYEPVAPTSLLLASTSAPSTHSSTLTRAYSRRADSVSTGDEQDGTVRRKRLSGPEKPSLDTKGDGSRKYCPYCPHFCFCSLLPL